MRYYKFLLVAPNNYLHPIERDILPNYDLKREALLHLDYICDGSGVLVYRMRNMGADLEQAEEDLKNHSMVIDYDVFDVRDDIFHLYVWFKPGGPATKLMSIGNRYGLIIEPPFYFNENGNLEVTTVGKNEVVQQSLPEFVEATENLDVVLEQVGEYKPMDDNALSTLTERQREIVETAVRKGYYSIPREATHEEIADEIGCSASTVGEHLRKAEARLIPELINI